ncbi:MAG: hypothetical protein AAEJ65_05700 [Planctomycetota bacterium]
MSKLLSIQGGRSGRYAILEPRASCQRGPLRQQVQTGQEADMLRCTQWIAALLLVLIPSLSSAQGDQTALERRWKSKQAASFLKQVSWERTLDLAMTRARRDNLPIVAYFTRSYAP